MGLKMDLSKENNRLYYDLKDAYWAISSLEYFMVGDSFGIEFSLCAYPSRDSKLANSSATTSSTLPFGGNAQTYDSEVYRWNVSLDVTDIFPDGSVPAGKDAQYTAIYNWIKAYTGLPFEDVLEE